jgi:hypothetical protein
MWEPCSNVGLRQHLLTSSTLINTPPQTKVLSYNATVTKMFHWEKDEFLSAWDKTYVSTNIKPGCNPFDVSTFTALKDQLDQAGPDLSPISACIIVGPLFSHSLHNKSNVRLLTISSILGSFQLCRRPCGHCWPSIRSSHHKYRTCRL